MKINDFNIRRKVVTMALAGSLTAFALLPGCANHRIIDTKRTYNKAIIFDYDNKTAAVVEVKSWKEYEENQFQIQTNDNFWFTTSSFDTKLIDDRNAEISIEEFIISILGEDAQINYLLPKSKVRTKE